MADVAGAACAASLGIVDLERGQVANVCDQRDLLSGLVPRKSTTLTRSQLSVRSGRGGAQGNESDGDGKHCCRILGADVFDARRKIE
jgi:hypothetical protein